MVFGYYSVTVQTLDDRDVPSSLGIPPGARVKEMAKVGHIMWIPFIPLGNFWAIEQNGNKYELPYKHEQYFKSAVGAKGTPWYSFLGFILIAGFIGLSSVTSYFSSKARKAANEERIAALAAAKEEAVNNPGNNQLYYLTNKDYSKMIMKLNTLTDSVVTFDAAIPEAKLSSSNDKFNFAYFDNENNPTSPKKVSRSTFNTMLEGYKNNRNPQWRSIAELSDKQLKLDKIIKIPEDKSGWPVVDKAGELELAEVWRSYVNNFNNSDSVKQYISTSSYDYYKDIVELSKKDAVEQVKAAKRAQYPNMKYELLLYSSKYFTDDKKDVLNTEDFEGYMFFIRLLEKGIWTLGKENLEKMKVMKTSFDKDGNGKVTLSAPSNMLQQSKPIYFSVKLEKEEGKWKIYLPSGYHYNEQQISEVGFSTGGRDYRKMVREGITKEGDITLEEAWNY